MKNSLNKTGENKLNFKRITIARLNAVQSEMIKGGEYRFNDDGGVSITTVNGGGTFQSGYMGSNCQIQQTKPVKDVVNNNTNSQP